MASVRPCKLPDQALLRKYVNQGAYTDCYVIEVAGPVSQEQYVEAFYTTAPFKLERVLLAWFIGRPSTDAQAGELARGSLSRFAAWDVEARANEQLLMCDLHSRTRSWLMTAPGGGAKSTRLFFGSAVVPVPGKRSGEPRMGLAFSLLLGFHKLYSRVLLRAAALRLESKLWFASV